MLRTSNPVLRESTFENLGEHAYSDRMTVDGTVNRTLILLSLVVVSALGVWVYATGATGALIEARMGIVIGLAIGGAIAGLILAVITAFRRLKAVQTAPLYAVAEGLFLGALSTVLETHYPGIALQAGALTMLVMFTMLGLYKTGVIKATARFRAGVITATCAVMFFYMISFVASMLGFNLLGGLFAANPLLSIGLSVFLVGLAALNLILDFDFIERGAAAGLPKAMEWYGAFALTVTLVWLYFEILRLLAKLRRR